MYRWCCKPIYTISDMHNMRFMEEADVCRLEAKQQQIEIREYMRPPHLLIFYDSSRCQPASRIQRFDYASDMTCICRDACFSHMRGYLVYLCHIRRPPRVAPTSRTVNPDNTRLVSLSHSLSVISHAPCSIPERGCISLHSEVGVVDADNMISLVAVRFWNRHHHFIISFSSPATL